MLHIWFGKYCGGKHDGIGKTDFYFDQMFDRSHILDDFPRRLIKGVVGSEVITKNILTHPV